MRHYPAFLNLSACSCLVVGAGAVGLRKITTLLSAGPREICVLDLGEASKELLDLCASPSLHFEQREFDESDLKGRTLVFACTNNAKVNSHIAELCQKHGTLCNIADAPDKSTFIVPASLKRGALVLALSTGGASPAVSRRIRMELEKALGPEYEPFVAIMGRLRPLILNLGLPTAQNTTLFRQLALGPLPEALRENDMLRVRDLLNEALPPQLHSHIGELLDGIE
ncbi:bifunctional precorrin-2 dehydrogenase/sirohydrochlorin ferrochelatase [Desulfobaculum bizertense]|uniref:precorrin-2 dehydrogenase/sirohydrochlorin ferrochelatase family protein n=1 Tax=Desulfobaculum bizertense TaxID=376490 RepID=UPI001F1E1FE0|nr:bifunctional precorrin-2 dehydrogenase/sirohydrochlorin ferrochelatase [Desulfobaculum bizertense]UIJ38814.1 bifunctional precorrin-2 dehydrogenase/sirohydrochlorin ferrochelatase [Desulfobaculum bizertense]